MVVWAIRATISISGEEALLSCDLADHGKDDRNHVDFGIVVRDALGREERDAADELFVGLYGGCEEVFERARVERIAALRALEGPSTPLVNWVERILESVARVVTGAHEDEFSGWPTV